MSRKRSIPDSKSAGRSSIVPYRRGEDFRTRHWRRLATSLEQEAEVRRWCVKHGMTLRITNQSSSLESAGMQGFTVMTTPGC